MTTDNPMDVELEQVGAEVEEQLPDIAVETKPFLAPQGFTIEHHEGKFNPNQVKFLVYGQSGSGKTRFASNWPTPIYMDIEDGMGSVVRKVYRVPTKTMDDVRGLLTFLETSDHRFKTLVIDSLNELQTLVMHNLITHYTSIRRAYDDLPSQSDYGKMLDDFYKVVRRAKALSMNVVMICNAASQEFETDMVQPQLTGKNTANTVNRMMDVIGYLYKAEPATGGSKRRMMVFDAVAYVTKDRSGVLPGVMEDPTYKKMYEHWKSRFEAKETK